MNHELVLLAEKIEWSYFEKEFSKYYSNTGQHSMPVRLMVGSLLLKRLYNLGDETLCKAWAMNPYMQYFCGSAHFEYCYPCDASDLAHFRKRIGAWGTEKIFSYSVSLHGGSGKEKLLLSDTTLQENNTTYPSDAKLAKKVIDKCNRIARAESVAQRQSYVRVSKQLLRLAYNADHPQRRKQAVKATRKLRTTAGRQVRELERKLSVESLERYRSDLMLFKKVLEQGRGDKNKIYSLHKPFTACIAKGKAGRKYEFGNKIGLAVTSRSLIISGIKAFEGNPHDSRTIAPLLKQIEKNLNYKPEEVVYDRGGRGKKMIDGVRISIPSKPKATDSVYQKRKNRKKFRRRAAIEPVIGHLKHYFRMGQNYLNGKDSPQINAFLAAAGWNMKLMMKKLKQEADSILQSFFPQACFIFLKLKTTRS